MKRSDNLKFHDEEPLFLPSDLESSTGYSFLDLHDLRERGWGFENLSRFQIQST